MAGALAAGVPGGGITENADTEKLYKAWLEMPATVMDMPGICGFCPTGLSWFELPMGFNDALRNLVYQ